MVGSILLVILVFLLMWFTLPKILAFIHNYGNKQAKDFKKAKKKNVKR